MTYNSIVLGKTLPISKSSGGGKIVNVNSFFCLLSALFHHIFFILMIGPHIMYYWPKVLFT